MTPEEANWVEDCDVCHGDHDRGDCVGRPPEKVSHRGLAEKTATNWTLEGTPIENGFDVTAAEDEEDALWYQPVELARGRAELGPLFSSRKTAAAFPNCPKCGSSEVTLPEDWVSHDNDRATCRSCGKSFTGKDTKGDKKSRVDADADWDRRRAAAAIEARMAEGVPPSPLFLPGTGLGG
jgi:transcription elongation factor Elf1